jgi:hypothetical protein
LQNWGFVLNDAKRESGHLRSLGFAPMKRDRFDGLRGRTHHRAELSILGA